MLGRSRKLPNIPERLHRHCRLGRGEVRWRAAKGHQALPSGARVQRDHLAVVGTAEQADDADHNVQRADGRHTISSEPVKKYPQDASLSTFLKLN